MKPKTSKFLVAILLVLMASCGDPETIVTDIVHPDGSVTRRLEMRSSKNDFGIDKIQVPFDSTWTFRDSLEVSDDGDTTWVKRAEKHYSDIGQLNAAYMADSGANKDVRRRVDFRKKFRWFFTEYKYSQTIDEQLVFGYPVSDFLNNKELIWFYSNGNTAFLNMRTFKPAGIFIDTSEYETLDSLVRVKTDEWSFRNLISEWAHTFAGLTKSSDGIGIDTTLIYNRKDLMFEVIKKYEDSFDTLWEDGTILKELIGESDAKKYKVQADSALNYILERFLVDFSEFDQKTLMPGRLIGGNGFLDSAGFQRWRVKSDFFMSEPYVMYAESKVTNWWAWLVSGIFIAFVISGIIFRKMQKG